MFRKKIYLTRNFVPSKVDPMSVRAGKQASPTEEESFAETSNSRRAMSEDVSPGARVIKLY
jgi:hypothetical protein